MKILHKIQHLLGFYNGYCDAFYDENNVLYMSFVCNTCGKRTDIHPCDGIIDRELTLSSPLKEGE
ncbi:MAG: hypothetical protein ACP5N7_04590 [Candidatus Pacearchaeota archaeon]